MHRRQLHNVNVNYSRTTAKSLNRYAFVEDVAGDAGINGVATDPFDWGVPALSFSSLSSVRDVAPSRPEDTRLTLALHLDAAVARHTLRLGGDFRFDRADEPDRRERERRVRLHRALHVRRPVVRARRRPRLRRLPARPAAAGVGPVRSRQRTSSRAGR